MGGALPRWIYSSCYIRHSTAIHCCDTRVADSRLRRGATGCWRRYDQIPPRTVLAACIHGGRAPSGTFLEPDRDVPLPGGATRSTIRAQCP